MYYEPRNASGLERSEFNFRREKSLCILAALFTLTASSFVALDLYGSLTSSWSTDNWGGFVRHGVFALIIACLVYGGLVYLLTRWAYYTRLEQHSVRSNDALSSLFNSNAPTLTTLVPSYKEEDKVIFQTLMSAALQTYSKKRVVLLLDDPPGSTSVHDQNNLALARTLPARVSGMLRPQAKSAHRARAEYFSRRAEQDYDISHEFAFLATQFDHAILWFEATAKSYPVVDHADKTFVDLVLLKSATLLRNRISELKERQIRSDEGIDATTFAQEYSRLVSIFTVEITSFERKTFLNLSHEPNKAMNLNSYIGLLGKRFAKEVTGNNVVLKEVDYADADAELVVPPADFVITLDADSIIAPDYALRLIDVMRQPGNERLAVVQTPYSAFPGAEKPLERIAGATTDIQYIIHQGFTRFDGTYWVGANALIRRIALDDIAVVEHERGFPVTRFIQDRTVIEDTESSVDLIEKGWRLHNYPERMAYSATPPDFGSLAIQRSRWANGGLVILPKLFRYLVRGPFNARKCGEAFLRVHYLGSIAAVNVGLVLALAFPLATDITTAWLPFTAIGYFLLYGRDLKLMGYKYRDLFGVYALNLLLIPVNLAGVFKSLHQIWTKKKIPFGRTPKVGSRTATDLVFVLALAALVVDWVVSAGISMSNNYTMHAVFAFANALILIYGIRVFLGFGNVVQDFNVGTLALRSLIHRRARIGWQRATRQTRNVLGNTPIVCLVVKPSEPTHVNESESASKEAA